MFDGRTTLGPVQYAYFGKDGKKYFWDLAPLCSERGYTVTTADNRTYGFNSTSKCFSAALPKRQKCRLSTSMRFFRSLRRVKAALQPEVV